MYVCNKNILHHTLLINFIRDNISIVEYVKFFFYYVIVNRYLYFVSYCIVMITRGHESSHNKRRQDDALIILLLKKDIGSGVIEKKSIYFYTPTTCDMKGRGLWITV